MPNPPNPYFIVQWSLDQARYGEEATQDLQAAIASCDARRAEGRDCKVVVMTTVEIY